MLEQIAQHIKGEEWEVAISKLMKHSKESGHGYADILEILVNDHALSVEDVFSFLKRVERMYKS